MKIRLSLRKISQVGVAREYRLRAGVSDNFRAESSAIRSAIEPDQYRDGQWVR